MKDERRLIVIGAGHNGLVAAFYLARAGLRPLVLERRPSVGGAMGTETFAEGARGPALAHAVGPLRASIVRDMRLNARGLEFVDADPAVVAPTTEGTHVALYRDVARTRQMLARVAPRDAERYPAFVDTLGRLARVLQQVLEMTPPEVDQPDRHDLWSLLSAARRFRSLPRADAFRLLRWMPMAAADLVGEYFEHEAVQATIVAPALAGTNLGPWSAGTGALLLLRAAADLQPGGSSLTVKGGPGALAAAMAQAATEAGAEIRTNAPVDRIEAGVNGVGAVRLETGDTIAASAVVSNADPRRTFLRLLDPTLLEPGFVWRVQNYRSRGTTAKINLLLSGLPRFAALDGDESLLRGRVHLGPTIDFLEQAFDASKYGRWPERPWLDVSIPTMADPGLAPSGRHVMSILAHFAPGTLRGTDWPDARPLFYRDVVRTLEEYAPGTSAAILAHDVLAPPDIESRFGMTGGHIHHGEPGLDQLFVMRPVMGWARYRTPVKGLYLCGAGTHPGPGLTGGPGQNAAREIVKDLA